MAYVGVVGSGPVGLATADQLAQAGHQVLIISPPPDAPSDPVSALPIRQTHQAALAFWTPFSSGLTAAEEQRMSQKTLEFYRRLDLPSDACGVAWRTVIHYWPEGTCRTPAWLHQPELDYRPLPYGPGYLSQPGVAFRWRAEYAYRAPVIDVDRFCRWYESQLLGRDAIQRLDDWTWPLVGSPSPLGSEANDAWAQLLIDRQLQAIVVCTGAGTVYSQLCDDEQILPNRVAFKKGVVARVAAEVDPEEEAVLFHGGMFDRDALCYVPHARGYVVGGTVHPASATNTAADWQVHEEEKLGIRWRAETFLPPDCQENLTRAGFWAADPISGVEWRAGVRPMLAGGGPVVGPARRLSRRFGEALGRPLPVVAHFGHGGSGFTVCHDTAALAVEEVASALESALITR